MVQIKLSDNEKDGHGGTNLLPTTDPTLMRRTVENGANSGRRSFASSLLVILSIIFTVCAVKQICDLREQNLSLMQQLAFERQKDAALKLAVRDNIPQNRFLGHRFNSAEARQVEAEGKVEQPPSTWTINLSVLWTSPHITPCDMARLSHILAEEIYAVQEEHIKSLNTWSDVNEDEAMTQEDSAEASEEQIEYENNNKVSESAEEMDSSEELASSEELDSSEELADSPLIKPISEEIKAMDKTMKEDYEYVLNVLNDAAIWDDSDLFE